MLYTAVRLLPFEDSTGGTSLVPSAINSSAVVAGHDNDIDGNAVAGRWVLTSPRKLGTLGGPESNGLGLNDEGCICGMATTSAGEQHAVLWVRGLVRDLGTLTGVTGESVAYGLGMGLDPVVCGRSTDGNNRMVAVYWQGLVPIALPSEPGWMTSEARAFAGSHSPAGWAMRNDGARVAVWWPNGGVSELGGLANYTESAVLAAADSGFLVGMSNTGSGTSSQAVLLNGTPTSLQNLSGVLSSIAKGVNRHGVVVGEFGSATKSGAFVYALNDGAQMIDLDTRLVPGGPIERVKVAFAVSDSGIIAAIGEDSNLANVGVLLLPN